MKALKLILLFTILFVIGSCEKDQDIKEEDLESRKKGTRPSDNVACIFDGEHSLKGPKAGERHRLGAIPVTCLGCSKMSINIYFTDDCHDSVVQATLDAIEAFNAVPATNLMLTVVDDLIDADIAVRSLDTGGACKGGRATLDTPIDVLIYSGHTSANCFCGISSTSPLSIPFNECSLKFMAMHELGHAIGFGHTDNHNQELITGTPIEDEFSIFNSAGMSNALCQNICEFTDEDINAIQTLYPLSLSCGGSYSGNSSTFGYQIYPRERFDVPCSPPSTTITFSAQANDVPNKFRILEVGGGTVVGTGWIGYSNIPGPWGPVLNGPPTANMTFTSTGGKFYLEVETVVQGQSDAWSAQISCN